MPIFWFQSLEGMTSQAQQQKVGVGGQGSLGSTWSDPSVNISLDFLSAGLNSAKTPPTLNNIIQQQGNCVVHTNSGSGSGCPYNVTDIITLLFLQECLPSTCCPRTLGVSTWAPHPIRRPSDLLPIPWWQAAPWRWACLPPYLQWQREQWAWVGYLRTKAWWEWTWAWIWAWPLRSWWVEWERREWEWAWLTPSPLPWFSLNKMPLLILVVLGNEGINLRACVCVRETVWVCVWEIMHVWQNGSLNHGRTAVLEDIPACFSHSLLLFFGEVPPLITHLLSKWHDLSNRKERPLVLRTEQGSD